MSEFSPSAAETSDMQLVPTTASIAFVWSAAQPTPAFRLFAGRCPTPLVGAMSAPFGTPCGERCSELRFLAPPLQTKPAALGFRLVSENDYLGGNDMKKDIRKLQ